MNVENLKIIIVDDDEQFRLGLKFYLETEYYFNVIGEASNGVELLKQKNIHNADIILMDLMMPEKNGYQTAAEIMAKNRNAKIIAIVSKNETTTLIDIIQAGFKACVFKENIINELLLAIKKVLKNEYYISEGITI